MKLDRDGFLSPVVDSALCVGCKLCEKACPIVTPTGLERYTAPRTYACWNANAQSRLASASGGMFSVYAEAVLNAGGSVFAVEYDAEFRAVFTQVDAQDGLNAQRCSKYVQAEVGTIYRDVKQVLESGRLALFVGSPCQVAGLYGYLDKSYETLFTLDLVCHGVPSPTLFRKWLDALEQQKGTRLNAISMRAKNSGCEQSAIRLDWSNGETDFHAWTTREADYLGEFFLSNASLRRSCGSCPFASLPRQGDVTLGDFWNLGQTRVFERQAETRDGVSMNLVNSVQGERLQALASSQNAALFERELSEALASNLQLSRPSRLHRRRERFVADSVALTYAELREKYAGRLGPTFLERVGALLAAPFKKYARKYRRHMEKRRARKERGK